MSFNEECKIYNYVKVTLKCSSGSYVLSRVCLGKSSFTDSGGPHLQSISIEGPSLGGPNGAINSSGVGTTGSVSIVDYQDKVFGLLSGHLGNFLNGNANLFPKLEIDIKCWAGELRFCGVIQNWHMTFSGQVPTLVIDWGQFPSVATSVATDKMRLIDKSSWQTPGDLLSAIYNDYPADKDTSDQIKVEFISQDGKTKYNGKDIDKAIKFVDDKPVEFNYSDIYRATTNDQLNALKFLANKSVSKDGLQLRSYIVADEQGSTLRIEEMEDKNGKQIPYKNKTLDELVFVQNTHYPAYTKHNVGKFSNKYVVPIQNFNFETDFATMATAVGIIPNINGNSSVGTYGYGTVNGDASSAASETAKQSDVPNNLTMSFECYNVALFSANDFEKPINLIVYTEDGRLHPLSKTEQQAMVTGFRYELAGAVIKATITCTTVYNSLVRNLKKKDNGTVTSETAVE